MIDMRRMMQAITAVGWSGLLLWSTMAPGATVTYQYDALHRLIAVDYGNGARIAYTYDPAGNILTTVRTSPGDSDGDGLTDDEEVNVYGTDPTLFDSDGDGLGDGVELGLVGYDADPSTTTDPRNPDSDGDGV